MASTKTANRKSNQADNINRTEHWSISKPDAKAAFILLLTFRLASALFNHISDCDETFNYLEVIQ